MVLFLYKQWVVSPRRRPCDVAGQRSWPQLQDRRRRGFRQRCNTASPTAAIATCVPPPTRIHPPGKEQDVLPLDGLDPGRVKQIRRPSGEQHRIAVERTSGDGQPRQGIDRIVLEDDHQSAGPDHARHLVQERGPLLRRHVM